ncbi:hypothetical protein NPIL_132171 [Nephila pilipes]|uniref:Uncharacterized protein n=1 Tax=Nephila pilipes TaxID=299642 RepID=A0A8X6PAG8_NEPPI|nr:hypothetical protein NPIL_132171 [Nephila pilipes]
MPQRLHASVFGRKVERTITLFISLGKEPAEFVQLCQNLVRNVPSNLPWIRVRLSLLGRNETVSEPCHKYSSTTFVRNNFGRNFCRSRNFTLIRTDKRHLNSSGKVKDVKSLKFNQAAFRCHR